MSDIENRARRWKENRNLQREVSVYGVGRSLAMELADIVDDIVQWKTRKDGIRQRYHYKVHRKGVLDTLPHPFRFNLIGKGKDVQRSVVTIKQNQLIPISERYPRINASDFNLNPDKYAVPGRHMNVKVESG